MEFFRNLKEKLSDLTTKQIVLIVLAVVGVLALLTLPILLFPESEIARNISWPALFVESILLFILGWCEFLMFMTLAFGLTRGQAGKYSVKTWGMLILCMIIGGVLCAGLVWVLKTSEFVIPFTGKTFGELFDKA